MRALATLLFLISSSIANAQGESIIGDLSNTSATGTPNFSAHFQFGEAPELANANPGEMIQIRDNLRIIEQNLGSNLIIHVLDPEGENAPLSYEIQNSFSTEHHKVKQSTLKTLKERLKSSLIKAKPRKSDWIMGLVFGTVNGVAAGIVSIGYKLPIEAVIGISLSAGTASFLKAVINQPVMNLASTLTQNEEKGFWGTVKNRLLFISASAPWEFSINFLDNLIALSLGRGNNIPQFIVDNTIRLLAGKTFSGAKSKMLGESRLHLNRGYYFVLLTILNTVMAIEKIGQIQSFTHVGWYEVRWTIVASLAVYSSFGALNKLKPEWVIRKLESLYRVMDKKHFTEMNDDTIAVIRETTMISSHFCEASMNGKTF